LNEELSSSGLMLPKNVIVYSIQGPFFFGAIEKIERAFAFTHSDPKIIIFRLKHVPFMDMTGLQTFAEVIEEFHKRGVLIYLCEANPSVTHKLKKVGVTHWLIENRIFSSLIETVKHIK